MAFELPKEVNEFLGIESAEDLDGFKKSFDNKFVRVDKVVDRKDIMDPLFGRKIGEIETKIKNAAREVLGLDTKDLFGNDAKVDDVIKIVFNKAHETHQRKITELEGKIGKTDNEALEELQGEYDKLKQTHETKVGELTTLKDDAVEKYQQLEKSTGEKFREIKIDGFTREAHNKIDWARSEKDFDLKYKGFQAQMNEKYSRSLNDEGEFIVTDKNGERIKDDKVSGEFKSYDAVLKQEALDAGLIKVNSAGGNKLSSGFSGKVEPKEGEPIRKINTSTRG